MRARVIVPIVAVACVLAVGGCSRSPATAPGPTSPSPEPVEFQFDVRFSSAEGGYTVRRVEYADSDGFVRTADFHPPIWNRNVMLQPGDRLHLRAEVEFERDLDGVVQIWAPGFYRSDRVASLIGPMSVVLEIDERVK
jgi:hypothetical protein